MEHENEHGITLVELLAAIVITAIIGTVGYNLLFTGFETFNQVKAETELRDEADLIMSSLINDLFTLKLSEVDTEKSTERYLALSSGEKIGFVDGKMVSREREIQVANKDVELVEGKIVEVEEGYYEIILSLKWKDRNCSLETESSIAIINDLEPGVSEDETI